MKLHQLYMALFCILMSAQTAFAQQNMLVVNNNGAVEAVSISSVDYATFNAGSTWFSFSDITVDGVVDDKIYASCRIALASDSVKELANTPEVGVCYSRFKTIPTVEDDCCSLGSELQKHSFTLSSLKAGTEYYIRPYLKLVDEVFYGNATKITTGGTKIKDDSRIIDGHLFVDLGLPSGLLWAETNVGADKKTECGNYYAWGETEPQKSKTYWWNSYKYGTSATEINKYNATDSLLTLEQDDDAAYVNWSHSCRTPSKDEIAELINNCTWTWETLTEDGVSVNGYKVTSAINGNEIFLPATGWGRDGFIDQLGEVGYYWSNTIELRTSYDKTYSYYAYDIHFTHSEHFQGENDRCYGYCVRPVANP